MQSKLALLEAFLLLSAVFALGFFLFIEPVSSVECSLAMNAGSGRRKVYGRVKYKVEYRDEYMDPISWPCGIDRFQRYFRHVVVNENCISHRFLGYGILSPPSFLTELVQDWHWVSQGSRYSLVLASYKYPRKSYLQRVMNLWKNDDAYCKAKAILTALGLEDKHYHNFAPAVESSNTALRSIFPQVSYDSCRDSNKGYEYNGSQSTTASGEECQPWSSQSPNAHIYTNLPGAMCRNPNHNRGGPWCFLKNRVGFDFCNISYCPDREDEGFMLLVKKGAILLPYHSAVFVVPSTVPMRPAPIFWVKWHVDYLGRPAFDIDALTPAHIELFDFKHFNVYDDMERYRVNRNRGKLLIPRHEEFACRHNCTLNGWEFIPGNTGNITMVTLISNKHGHLFTWDFTFMTMENYTITEEMIHSDDNQETDSIKYICRRDFNGSVLDVQYKTTFGIYQAPDTGPDIIRTIYAADTIYHLSEPFPCGSQLTTANSERTFEFDINFSNHTPGTVFNLNKNNWHAMKFAIRPIIDPDFVYTCFCESHQDCQIFGDMNMLCHKGRCTCRNNGFEFYRRTNKCIHATTALNRHAYQSSTSGNHEASLAVDSNSIPSRHLGTFSKTLVEWHPWWVVDMGIHTNVYAVRLTAAPTIAHHIVLGENNKPPEYVFTNDVYNDIHLAPLLKSNLDPFTVHGPVPWLGVQQDNPSNWMILNGELQETITYRGNENLPFTNFGSLRKISLYNLYSEDGVFGFYLNNGHFDIYMNPKTQSDIDNPPIYWCCYRSGVGYQWIDHTTNTFLSIFSDHKPKFDKVEIGYFKLYETKTDMESGNDLTIEEVIAGQKLVLLTIGDLCLSCTDPSCVFNNECNIRLRLVPHFTNMVTYIEHTWTPPYSEDIVNIDVDTSQFGENALCYKSLGAQDTNSTTIVTIMAKRYNRSVDMRLSTNDFNQKLGNGTVEQNQLFWLSISDPAFYRGRILVGERFNGVDFVLDNFLPCVNYIPMIEPGKETYYDCNIPTHGRYVALFSDAVTSLEFNNVQLLTFTECLPGQSFHGCNMEITCENVSLGCQHECIEDDLAENGVRCSCPTGYSLAEDGVSCEDTDECSEEIEYCDQICINTLGGFTCSCYKGYMMMGDELTCGDVNECEENYGKGPCEHSCINLEGSFQCQCNPGYHLTGKTTCADTNECVSKDNPCQHKCVNNKGSYTCTCPPFTTLDENGHSCNAAEDLCASRKHDCTQMCVWRSTGYSCECLQGYSLSLDGRTCYDIDECENENGQCHHLCTNSIGSYKCSCDAGFALAEGGSVCEDVNECELGTHGCQDICINTVGSYLCTCKQSMQLHNGGAVCVAPVHNILRLESGLRIRFIDAYKNLSSSVYQDLKKAIESNFQEKFKDLTVGERRYPLEFIVDGPFRRPYVKFEIMLKVEENVTLIDFSVLLSDMRKIMTDKEKSSYRINGNQVLESSPLHMATTGPATKQDITLLENFQSECTTLNLAEYCLNGGSCGDGVSPPVCVCATGFGGERCETIKIGDDSDSVLDLDVPVPVRFTMHQRLDDVMFLFKDLQQTMARLNRVYSENDSNKKLGVGFLVTGCVCSAAFILIALLSLLSKLFIRPPVPPPKG